MANDLIPYDNNRDLVPPDNNSESEVITLPKQEVIISPKREVTTFPEQEEKYSIIPTIVSNAFNKHFWDKRNAIEPPAFNKHFWGDKRYAEDANIIDDPINMSQPERQGLPEPPAKERASGDLISLPEPERQGLPEPIKVVEAKQPSPKQPSPKQPSPIVEKKKGSEVSKTLLKTLGKGASFLLPYLIKAAAAGIDNLAALPKTALEGSMSPEQKALYGGGLAGAFANVSAAAPLPVTDRMREIADALLLHRMQQKYIDMLKKQADYMKTLDLNGHQLDYLGRQASGIAFMNNKAPGAINGIKR